MVMETPHLYYGPDQGGPDESVPVRLGLGQQSQPQQAGGGVAQAQPDKGYDFGDVIVNFLFKGIPLQIEKFRAQQNYRKAEQELRRLESIRQRARSDLNRAQVAFQNGKLERAVELMGGVYDAFPDGITYSKIAPGQNNPDQLMVWFKDKNTGEERPVFPLNEDSVKYAIKEADAGLRGDNFMKEQVAALVQRKAQNRDFLDKAEYNPETETYSWWHVDRNGDYTVRFAPKDKFPGVKKRYDDTDDVINKFKKDFWKAHFGIEKERLKQIRDPRQSELTDLRLQKERLGLKKAKQGLGSYIQVGDKQMTIKEIEAEMKVLKAALNPPKGDKPLMLVSEMLQADDAELKTEFDRWQKLAEKAKSPQTKRAAQRYLQLFKAVTGFAGKVNPETREETAQDVWQNLVGTGKSVRMPIPKP